jgi:nucleoporin NUP82
VPDLLYSDTVYVHHSLGAHALCIGTWARDLLDAMNTAADATPGRGLGADGEPQVEDRQGAVARVLHRAEPTQVVWAVKTPGFDAREQRHTPICGLCIISDVYLSYALLAVAAPCTPVALELNMRVPEELEAVAQDHAEHATRGLGDAGPAQGYVSLLGDGPPFAVPSLFRSGSTLPNAPRVIARGGEVEITPDTLRELGTTAERLRDQMRSVVSAGNVVQGRLDLQLREMSRQLERLADVRRRCRGSRADGGESLEARPRGCMHGSTRSSHAQIASFSV